MVEIKINNNQSGIRIDKFLLSKYTKMRIINIQKFIKKKEIKVNGKKVNSDYILQQIKVTLGYNDKYTTYSLCDFEQISLDLGVLAVEEDAEFTISINLPAETTNEAQSQNVYFDLKLEATQVLFEK
jgi:23S rRNA-/tRNA-specific pseudouridylate synthase